MFELARKRNQPLILVADDDRSIRTMATDALQAQGYAVVEAEDGEQVLELFRRHSPSLVILDVTMPGMDGLSACRELRRSYPELAVPVLVLTGAEAESSVDRAYEAGATDFLNKPVSATLLCHRIRYLLRASDAVLQLRQSQESLANAQRIARLGSWEWDADTGVMQWSDETYRICGMEPGPAEVSFERMARCVHPDDLSVLREEMNGVLEQGKRFSVEHRILLPGGEVRHVHQRGELVGGGPLGGRWVSGTIQDVTDQVHTQEKIRHLARYDSLTNLANRRLFKEQLARAIEAAEMHNHLVGLLYMDLDRFKQVNDTLGHSAGDELLKEVAERLRHHVRGSDLVSRGNKLSVSRLGGDEFTVLLSKISAAEDAGEVARRILRALPVPVRIEGHDVSPHISIGVAIYPLDGQDVDTLMKSADAAMYHAKEGGRNRYQFFSESMNAASLRKLTLESRLREAVQRDELCLHYQPRVDLATGTVVGTEALLRWEHPVLGMVSPVEFIPVSEESGLIISIGRWVLDAACAQNKAWQDAGHRAVRVSVNVSTRQFVHHDLRRTVETALEKSGLEPRYLELEITESLMIDDDQQAAQTLRELRELGILISLDDFGTGYSSLSYITRFPLDSIKIDRCFVQDVDSDPAAAGVVTAVIEMAHSLGLRVVAEGVESEPVAAFLRERGCDEMQGFLLSPAVSPEAFAQFLVRERD